MAAMNDGFERCGQANFRSAADLALVAGFAGASAAAFGATFVYAGKTGLIKRRDRKSE